ncbi:hypothetical protein AB0K09_06525 [Streptomyces sp. NPDC049577]|uniref:hypothetical protein n=1 Tax=Streptomyces sp. NPDC049577 TaxID=3155153 RepID=UPI00342A1721
MTAGDPERPLIPQPPATSAALRQAVAKIAPAALPAFNREADAAADEARQGADLAPLRRFVTAWAVYVQIQRQPRVAARFRELEDLVAVAEDEAQVRSAAAELGRILDDAHQAVERGER